MKEYKIKRKDLEKYLNEVVGNKVPKLSATVQNYLKWTGKKWRICTYGEVIDRLDRYRNMSFFKRLMFLIFGDTIKI
jgi:hypothetical protein